MTPRAVRFTTVSVLALFLCLPGFGAVLDAYDDLSSSNPSGLWTYGYTPALNGVFVSYTDYFAAPDAGALGFEAAWRSVSAGDDYLGLYKTATPGLLVSHPGAAAQYSVLRFTAPGSGDYTLSSTFSGQDAATTDVYVYANGVQFFASSINGLGETVAYNQIFSLSPGQVVDMIVGYGANGTSNNDATGLRVLMGEPIAAVPEPGTALLLVTGLALLVGSKRKLFTHK